MSNSRISSPRRKARRSTHNVSSDDSKNFHRFLGLSLSGGKADKACLAVVEYYPNQKRIFLARLYEKIKTEEFISADLKIHELIQQYHKQVETLALDVPLSLPKCMNCNLKCPGYETCTEAEIVWMRDTFAEVNKEKRPKKMFTPYTQRCVDAYLGHKLEENFEVQHALGSNLAPITARARFLTRRLQLETIEVNPKISIWRIGSELKVNKSHLKHHRNSSTGDESRKSFLQHLSEKKNVFIYQQDSKSMIENNHAFEAFICAYTGLLAFLGKTQDRPKNFPKKEAWITLPKLD
ncbi:MAG: DUF429 domain-containing protein [Pseudobdellovibrionaceae bacterium]